MWVNFLVLLTPILHIICNHLFITVLANLTCKISIVQNSPPHNCFFTWGQHLKISIAVRLLIIVTSFVTEYVGTDWIKKWTWSSSFPISRNLIWYCVSIFRQTTFSSLSTAPSNTALRYFAGKNKWYSKTVRLWLLRMYWLILPFYAASGGEYGPERFKP